MESWENNQAEQKVTNQKGVLQYEITTKSDYKEEFTSWNAL